MGSAPTSPRALSVSLSQCQQAVRAGAVRQQQQTHAPIVSDGPPDGASPSDASQTVFVWVGTR
jgi:hypothetical protein